MVIPHAFSRNAQPGLKEQNVNIADTPYYLVASNMEYFKGLDLILHAFIRYKRQGGKAALVFAGTRGWSDPYPTARYVLSRPDVQKLIPEAKSAGVSFAGSINKEELSQLRRGALATVVGSRFEAFTMVAGEAFLSGCPVILSSRTGWRDLAERYAAALIVDPIDIVSFAGAMLQMERPEVRERICTGGERLAEYLTSSELWEKTAAWYQRVAGRGV
jgi:glycosyltransferase involved in cell wall biosynthesis